MVAPIGASTSRFTVESHDHNFNLVASLPYKNGQGEFLLGSQGSQMRIEIPYRGYDQVTRANLWEGKHELWIYDHLVSTTSPIFAGPIWDITPSSSTGVLSVSAQDGMSYLTKRRLKVLKQYNNAQGADKIVDLVAYVNSIVTTKLITSKVTSNTQTSTSLFKSIDRDKISDLIASIADLDDKVDYYCRCDGTNHIIYLYGGLINNTVKPYALEYGGALDGYSVQHNAQAIANDYDVVSNNGRIGNAVDAGKQTEYNALYQEATVGVDLTSTTAVTNSATKNLKDSKSSKNIPTLVTRTKTPILDFDFGDQFIVVINDGYEQFNQTIRVIGWQLSINEGDDTTVNIYTKDNEGL